MHISVGSVDAMYPMSSLGIDHVSVFVLAISDPVTRSPTASPSLACSNEDCTRCHSGTSRLCCDTCNPGSFILPTPSTEAPTQSRAPNKFKVDSGGYLMTEAGKCLREALRNWRSTQLQALGASTGDDMFGSQLIMTDDILDRILDLAHFGQIYDLETLQNQVSWRYCNRWGPQVLDIIKTHFPFDPVPSRESLQPTENLPGPSTENFPLHTTGGAKAAASGTKTSKKFGTKSGKKTSGQPCARGQYRCGSCGSTTHIGTLSLHGVSY